MSAFINCLVCDTKNSIKTYATNRSELEKEQGEVISIRCKKCQNKRQYHVNEFVEEENKMLLGGGILLGLVLTFLLAKYMGYLAAATGVIPILIWNQEKQRVNEFNGYRIKVINEPKN